MGRRIIVIDDQVDIRNAFELALEDTDIEVDTADSGYVGIDKLSRSPYDLVFLDLKMPGMNGIETLQAIREKDSELPVYIITAFHKEFMEDLNEAQDKGYDFELLRKPLELDEIKNITCAIIDGYGTY